MTPVLSLLALGLLGQLGDGAVRPCVDEVTVRDSPSVKGARVGVVRRGAALPLLETTHVLDALTLTVDQNVPAPFTVALRDVWLKVALPADAGVASGWVFGGLMCRAAFPPSERWLTVLGWSPDDTKVAFFEHATDSFACGFGRPVTLRVVDVVTGRQLGSLEDGCPAADLLLSRRAEVEALLKKHDVRLDWVVVTRAPPALTVALAGPCAKGACSARLLASDGGVRAEVPLQFPAGALDRSAGFPKASLTLVARRPGTQVAFVRVQLSEEAHAFHAMRLSDEASGREAAWRDLLPGVHFTGDEKYCTTLEATTKDAASAGALGRLRVELARRLRKHYRDELSPEEQGCVLEASVSRGQLVLTMLASACVGNECPGDACKRALEFRIGQDFSVLGERKVPFRDYSCDP